MSNIKSEPITNTDSCCSQGHCHVENDNTKPKIYTYLPAIISCILLISGIVFDYINLNFFKDPIRIIWYTLAYIPVGFPVIKSAWNSIKSGEFFTEFSLMTIATLGAFALREYPEGVTVMLFYTIGEIFQGEAVSKAKGNIKALLDVRPKAAFVLRNGTYVSVNPESVLIGEQIQVRVGEKVPLDGTLLSDKASLNTSALTGESKPDTQIKGQTIYAGSINLDQLIEIEVTKAFKDSSISRILDLVQNAAARKAKTELFIRKFAKVYTPIVALLAVAITILPYVFVSDYVFKDWLYRALIFLVISCPCALVISIPLGYFGGLGAASRNGILFKGASFLEALTKVNTIVMDKTGTLTKGVFKIKTIKPVRLEPVEFMAYVQAIESKSTHPIAKAILNYKTQNVLDATEVSEIAGQGLKGQVNNKLVLVGNAALLQSHQIKVPDELKTIVETIVLLAIDNIYEGYIIIADELKADVKPTIKALKAEGISKIRVLSGDKDSITKEVAQSIDITEAEGGLLPEDKLHNVETLKAKVGVKVAFVGDGINDAPVLAASDVGIAMGGLGSDVAIETADVIIQNDQISKLLTAIKISKSTRAIVWQNIALAFGVKLIVMVLGAFGIATMWEAVFADVGVAFLAILNAIRLQRMEWN